MAGRKRPVPEDVTTEGEGSAQPKSKKKFKPLDPKKFGGMTEEEVCKLVLPDHMKPDMDIIFVSCIAIGKVFLWWYFTVYRLVSILDSILPTLGTTIAMPTITSVGWSI